LLPEDISKLKSAEVKKFIGTVSNLDPTEIILRYHGNSDFPIKAIAEQIECKKKASVKLKTIYTDELIFTTQSLEQSSSESAASFKSTLLQGKNFIDITGGLGIDFCFISKNFETAIYCEQDTVLAEIFDHNSRIMNCDNSIIRNEDGLKVLSEFDDNFFDWILVDPSRRKDGRRSVDLKYCTPNLIEHFEFLLKKGKKILIKLSPAFDTKEAKKIFKGITDFYIVSVDDECKELLVIVDSNLKPIAVNIHSIIISNNRRRIFSKSDDEETVKHFSEAIKSNYIYIPNCSIIAADLTGKLANQFSLDWFSFNTHLLHGKEFNPEFPGRILRIENVEGYNQKRLTRFLKLNEIKSANIICKNFGCKPEEMYKKLKIKTGGNVFIVLTRNNKNQLISIIAERISQSSI